jgi:hypothetical protein
MTPSKSPRLSELLSLLSCSIRQRATSASGDFDSLGTAEPLAVVALLLLNVIMSGVDDG